jgi:hypothetical protein
MRRLDEFHDPPYGQGEHLLVSVFGALLLNPSF